MASTDSEGRVTLREFVEENHRLISVLGVLVALSAFSSGLRPGNLGLTLASVFLAMAVLVMLELWTAFPRGHATKRLEWFGVGMLATMGLVSVYWLLAFRQIWRGVLALPVWAALTTAFGAIISRPRIASLVSRLLRDRGRAGEAAWIALAVVITFALLYVSVRLARIAEPIVYHALTSLFCSP